MSEEITTSQKEILEEKEKHDIQLSVALSSFVNFSDINCTNDNGEYQYKRKTVGEILEAEKNRLENLKSATKTQKNDLDEPIDISKDDLEYLPKEIAHTEFIVNQLNLGNLILMDSSLMYKNDEEFKKLGMNNGIRVYILSNPNDNSLYVVSKGTAPGEFSVLSDMIFASEKEPVTTNQEKKDDLIDINDNDQDGEMTIENKNEDELRKYAIGKQNIIFNNAVSKLLEPYMGENGDFTNEWKNIYFIGHSSGGNKVINLFANHILKSNTSKEDLERCKCICINSIGWADETKSYFKKQFKDRNIDFKKFANRVTDVKGSTDTISVINKNPIGKTVFMKSSGHYTEDINIDKFIDLPDNKYYVCIQFFTYLENYLSEIKDPVEKDEKIETILKAFDYKKNRQQTNVYGDDITTYRTKIFIIVLWVLLKYYIKAWFVVYVFRIKPLIEINPKITTEYYERRDSIIGNNRDINRNQEIQDPFLMTNTQLI